MCAKKRAGGGGDANGDHPFRHHCRSSDADRRIDRKSKSNAVMEYKIEELTREVRKHNGFAEKIPVIQRDIQVLNHRVSDIETHEHERS